LEVITIGDKRHGFALRNETRSWLPNVQLGNVFWAGQSHAMIVEERRIHNRCATNELIIVKVDSALAACTGVHKEQ
jgi:hypothetical protein